MSRDERRPDGLEVKEGVVLDAEGQPLTGPAPHRPFENSRVRVVRLGPVGGILLVVAVLAGAVFLITAGAAIFVIFFVGMTLVTLLGAVLNLIGVGRRRR